MSSWRTKLQISREASALSNSKTPIVYGQCWRQSRIILTEEMWVFWIKEPDGQINLSNLPALCVSNVKNLNSISSSTVIQGKVQFCFGLNLHAANSTDDAFCKDWRVCSIRLTYSESNEQNCQLKLSFTEMAEKKQAVVNLVHLSCLTVVNHLLAHGQIFKWTYVCICVALLCE